VVWKPQKAVESRIRVAVAILSVLATLAPAAPAAAVGGNWASASLSGNALVLKLHYEMQCGSPGRGTVTVQLPRAFSTAPPVTGFVNGKQQSTQVAGRTVTVALPKPPPLSCTSIAPGVLTLTLRGVRVAKALGTYAIRATVHALVFTARLRIR
jgi:hypothetical protein